MVGGAWKEGGGQWEWGLGVDVRGLRLVLNRVRGLELSCYGVVTVDFQQSKRGRIKRVHAQARHVHDDSNLRYIGRTIRAICVVESRERTADFDAGKMRKIVRGLGFI